jgi:penicillin-insensitive murein endopeptidase
MFARKRVHFVALSALVAAGVVCMEGCPAMAQAQAATASAPLPPAKPATTEQAREKTVPAKILFGEKKLPSVGKPMAIGYYPRGCLQGGVELPINGPTWQVMRLSRNRNWGHPSLVHFLEKFAPQAAKATGWKGVLVGDMTQPRGGPTVSDHASHQIGLDVDIWFIPITFSARMSVKRSRPSTSCRQIGNTSIRKPGHPSTSLSLRRRPSSRKSSGCW